MNTWYMLTVVGKDQPGIVAGITKCLFDAGCNLGEASMMRMAGNFTVMLMAQGEVSEAELTTALEPVVKNLALQLDVSVIEPTMHSHIEPNVSVTVSGADRAGIISQVTEILASSGVNILDLESAVAGSKEKPLYILHIEGEASTDVEEIEAALKPVIDSGIDIRVQQVETIIG